MKSIADLEAIRQKTLSKVNLRREHEGVRIVVGMATCGIAAGARPVTNAFIDEVGKRNLLNVVVAQTGCIGMAARIVADHVVNGKPVVEYTISEAE